MNNDTPLIDKPYAFAIRIVKACQQLSVAKREFTLTKQLLRCGPSIGANVEEAQGGISKADFSAKLSIAYKEARETKYWLKLLRDTAYFAPQEADPLLADADELCRLLFSAIRTARRSRNREQ